ncbi:MAG: ribulose-phosphate 3-epimerase [Staphylococcus equorum]|uniref:ribulose-phosphate 3-epimerase n=1 Tax=Staphylococcus TaxID=1279 RepID=UPI00085331F9|nr:ribulose-phosphate 3-epimerase [Staphylococcus equorum]MDG0821304.1 ribulose-phosphate 3-epimerase [Staphylococcus equorum]MDG0837787.1 ribulose-phosphate 3-epimerase [Staphylococcus equorum]MDK9870522.1 ribulose-phosphate 3-epimerase [Staphylococcus equorum]MDK9875920.1 ribulose-phosphate 3-epimerase [Staphylococcus equorum]MDN5809829.1 ribulose-phosphate 3-epimerase [Staphylococcus equorum]
MAKLYPSLLSTDFLKLQEELTALEEAGVDGVHFDVMDGQFVPNISIGLPILEAVRKGTKLPIDVHLMIEEPEKYVELFADYGADMISVHVEATPHIHRVIEQIKNKHVKAGVVINPGTPVDAILPVIKMVDFVLVMTVNPGFGGQSFISDTVDKLDQLSKIKDELNLDFEIEVDGGINNETVETVINHGATMLVAGSYFFKHDDYKVVTKTLKG